MQERADTEPVTLTPHPVPRSPLELTTAVRGVFLSPEGVS